MYAVPIFLHLYCISLWIELLGVAAGPDKGQYEWNNNVHTVSFIVINVFLQSFGTVYEYGTRLCLIAYF